jgi:hypothetical protein
MLRVCDADIGELVDAVFADRLDCADGHDEKSFLGDSGRNLPCRLLEETR